LQPLRSRVLPHVEEDRMRLRLDRHGD
jgi:hypothetical protein